VLCLHPAVLKHASQNGAFISLTLNVLIVLTEVVLGTHIATFELEFHFHVPPTVSSLHM